MRSSTVRIRLLPTPSGTFIIDEVIPGLEFQLWRRYASKRSGYGQGLVDKRKGRVRPDHRPWKAQAR